MNQDSSEKNNDLVSDERTEDDASEHEDKKPLFSRKGFGAIVAAAGLIVALPGALKSCFDLKDQFFPFDATAEPDMKMTFSTSDEYPFNEGRMFELFCDAVGGDNSFTGYMVDNCSTLVTIDNKSGRQISVREVGVKAKEITVDDTPYLSFESQPPIDGSPTVLPASTIDVSNHGWGEAVNVSFAISSEDPMFEQVFGKKKLIREIEKLDVASTVSIPFLASSDVINPVSGRVGLNISVTPNTKCDIWFDDPMQEQDSVSLGIEIEGSEVFFGSYGKGGGERGYGFLLPTDQPENQVSSGPILDYLQPGDNSIPFCCFPDKSCSMMLKPYLLVGTDKREVSTPWTHASFRIDSIAAKDGAASVNAKTISAEEIDQLLKGTNAIAVSYPFADSKDYEGE